MLSLLFFVDLAGASIEFMGFSGDTHAYDVILHRYGARIVLGQLRILASYAVIGAAFGAAGALIGRLWDRSPPSGARRMFRGAIAALAVHGYLLARSIAHFPQLYSEALYDRGGARRAIQVAITSRATPVARHRVLQLRACARGHLATALAPGRSGYHSLERRHVRAQGWLDSRSTSKVGSLSPSLSLALLTVIGARISSTPRNRQR